MRHAMASTCLVLVLGLPSCSKSTVDSELRVPTTVSLEASESIGAVEFLETMSWPPGVAPIDLSSSAENQLRRMIFNDAEITASVRDIAAVGLTIDGQPNGALMLIGVSDLVIGNITFVNGLEAAALSTFETARVREGLNNAIQSALTGSKSAADALGEAQAAAERLLKDYR